MNNITDVQNGLYNQLLLTPDLPVDIQRENERFKPSVRTDWVRVTLLPSATTKESLGLGGYNRLTGLYQIDLFTPSGRKDITDLNVLVDKVVNGYVQQITIAENNTNIRVLDVWRDVSITEGDWFRIPVIIRWESYQIR